MRERHLRRDEVTAMLIEGDPRNAQLARRRVMAAGRTRCMYARRTRADRMPSPMPADGLLQCGMFGNVSDPDIERTVVAAPALSAAGATVIWTRHRPPPDLTGRIRAWFTDAGFADQAFETLDTTPRQQSE